MYAPLTGEAEWVELWNLSDEAVSLRNWTINDATGNRVLVTSEEQFIDARGFLVLANASPLATRWPQTPSPVLTIAGFPALNNGGDVVVLRDADGVLIDSISYDGGWNSVRGSTLERMHPLRGFDHDNCGASAHVDAGTPGVRNSRTPPDIDCAVTALLATDTGFTIRVANRGLMRTTVANCLLLADRDRNGAISSGELFHRISFAPPAVLDSLELTAEFSDVLAIEFRAILELAGDGLAANDTAVARRMPLVQPGDFVVNEIMAAPPASTPEWVEFLNVSDRPLFPGGLRLAGPPALKGSRESILLPSELAAVPPADICWSPRTPPCTAIGPALPKHRTLWFASCSDRRSACPMKTMPCICFVPTMCASTVWSTAPPGIILCFLPGTGVRWNCCNPRCEVSARGHGRAARIPVGEHRAHATVRGAKHQSTKRRCP
jgi:hypothetical protein